ncbi:hypothetical protein PUR29_14140 [Methylobacterium ajmalii]|uniref:Uncharacterized protein n=1 Tax=Methylobacterium ajmalii TaxID=2738439 RepID=A0ABU9ZT59_9HYPH
MGFDDLIPAQSSAGSGGAPAAPAAGNLPALEEGGASVAITRGLINGIPVVGPYILSGANKAAAGIRALANDTRYSDELKRVEEVSARTARERPVTTLASELAGGVAGTLPLAAAAPAAFGLGSGGLAARSVASGLSGAAIGGADAAVRSDGDGAETRFGAALGGGLGLVSPGIGRVAGKVVGAVRGNRSGEAAIREAIPGISEEQMSAAGRLIDEAASLPGGGVRLTLDEALNHVTGGQASRLSQIARVVANSGGEGGRIMGELYAARPEAMQRVGRTAFDQIAPPNAAPSGIGLDVQDAARSALMQTPEGQALSAALEAAGPRVTPMQAGETIQSELRGVLDRATQQRERQAAVDYAAARDAPERFGIDRMAAVERPGEPALVTLDPGAAPAPRFAAPADGGPATIGSLSPQRQPAPVRDPAARSLSRFIAENGGITLERGDIRAAGVDRWSQPGIGPLVRPEGGKSIDGFWRTKLIEAGYLPPDTDGGMARNVHDELIGLLQQEQRGQRVYPFDWTGSDERSGFSRLRDDHQAAAGRATADIRSALTEAGVDPRTYDKGVLDRAAAAVMRGEATDPLDAVERAVMAAREPTARPTSRMEPTTIREQVPAPLFGQVDPGPAAAAIEHQARTAKGDVRSSLRSMSEDLKSPDFDPITGQPLPDMSVEGLLHARERWDQRIAAAVKDGDATLARDLQISRSALDGQLKQVPEVAVADANFATNSQALEPFKPGTPLGQATARDPLSGRMQMPAEQVPGTLAQPTAARDLVEVATPAARQAQEARLTTEILDSVTDQHGIPDAGKLRRAMLDREDTLAQLPGAREALANIVSAREGMARVEASPLGKLALQTPDGRKAASTLFPINPLPNSEAEIGSAVAGLARRNPPAARDLVRLHTESLFNEATQDLKGVPAQYGGAGFASALQGNAQQAKNLEAAVRALPEGDTVWTGFDKLLSTLEATGYRPQKGSDTAFNTQLRERLQTGSGPIGQAISEVASGAAVGGGVGGVSGALGGAVMGARRASRDLMREARMLGTTEAIAKILTDPRALPDLRALARAPVGSRNAEVFTQRLLMLANSGASSAREPGAAPAR